VWAGMGLVRAKGKWALKPKITTIHFLDDFVKIVL